MSHPDLRTAATPREALIAAVRELRRIADALTTPTASRRREAPPTCGEECAEGHTYAGRCTLYDQGACVWPDCLSDGQQAELAEQVRRSVLSDPTVPMPDQRQVCGCRDNARTTPDGPTISSDTPGGPSAETVHACPPDGSGITPCCGRTPFELPRTDRMSQDTDAVTCTSRAAAPDDQLRAAEAALARVEALAEMRAERHARTVRRISDLADRADPGEWIDPAALRFILNTQDPQPTAPAGPAPYQPVYDAVRDGHHDLDEPDAGQ